MTRLIAFVLAVTAGVYSWPPAHALGVIDCALALAPDRKISHDQDPKARRIEVFTRLSRVETDYRDVAETFRQTKARWTTQHDLLNRTGARVRWVLGSGDARPADEIYARLRTLGSDRRALFVERLRLRASARVIERRLSPRDHSGLPNGSPPPSASTVFERLAAGDAGPARQVLDRFDVGTLTTADLTRVSKGVYRVTLRAGATPAENIDGVLRIVPNVDLAAYERWCADFMSKAPGVVVSPVRVIQAPPSLGEVMHARLNAESQWGLRTDVSDLLLQMRRGQGPVPFQVTLAVWLPGRTGHEYLEVHHDGDARRKLVHALRNVDKNFLHTTWGPLDPDHMNEWFDHHFRNFDFDVASPAVAALRADLRTITRGEVDASNYRDLVRPLAIDAGVNGFERYVPLIQEAVFARLPAPVRTRLADLWAAAWLAGVDDLHASNWLIDGELVMGIDLNHANAAFAKGEAEYWADSLTGGRSPMSVEFRRMVADEISPAVRGWLDTVARGGAPVRYGLKKNSTVERGIRARARLLLDLR